MQVRGHLPCRLVGKMLIVHLALVEACEIQIKLQSVYEASTQCKKVRIQTCLHTLPWNTPEADDEHQLMNAWKGYREHRVSG